jgi:hypothetical protein
MAKAFPYRPQTDAAVMQSIATDQPIGERLYERLDQINDRLVDFTARVHSFNNRLFPTPPTAGKEEAASPSPSDWVSRMEYQLDAAESILMALDFETDRLSRFQ